MTIDSMRAHHDNVKVIREVILGCLAALLFGSLFISINAVSYTSPAEENSSAEEVLGEIDFSENLDSGCQIEAEKNVERHFNKAIALLHSFEYDESRRTFVSVLALAPNCAMAHWGLAMSYLQPLWAPPTQDGFYDASNALITAKDILKDKNNTKARKFVTALAHYFDGKLPAANPLPLAPSSCHGLAIGRTPHQSKLKAYSQAMASMYLEYPNDVDTALFYALSLIALPIPNDNAFTMQHKAGAIMQPFSKTHPNHPGLAHYIIHAYDNPILAKLGLEAAYRYADIAPDSAHARHMPSHIFQQLGMWQESIRSNIASTASARAYAKRVKLTGHWDEELHGLEYLTKAYMQTKQYEKAREIRDYIYSMEAFYPENFKVAYVLSAAPARYELDRKNWQGAAKLPLAHTFFPWGNFPWERAITHFAKGLGLARLGKLKKAKGQLLELETLQKRAIALDNIQLAERIDIQILKLSAWISFGKQNRQEALTLMKYAAELETQSFIYTGAILPSHEMLGDMYSELRRFNDAIDAYEIALAREPNRRLSLKGIIGAATAINDQDRIQRYNHVLKRIDNTITMSTAERPVP